MATVQMSAGVEGIPKTTPSLSSTSNNAKVFPEEMLQASLKSKASTKLEQPAAAAATAELVQVPLRALEAARDATLSTFAQLKNIATSDTRKIAHPLKVALALTITSVYVYLIHSQEFTGRNGIWAIMTVVVIFEFTAGATYSKGLNRCIGTFLASVLVLGISQLAMLGGPSYHRITACLSIFGVATAATFLRFVPKVKAKYDYGVLIFLLTFSLLMISSSSSNKNPLETASSRLYMVSIGCCVSLAVSTFIYPIWAGDELHNSICKNFDKLADSLEGSIYQYLHPLKNTKEMSRIDDDSIHKNYRLLTSSGTTEEALANFATWEPPHGRFSMVRFPWSQYIRAGKALRHCAYTSMALHGCLTSEVQAPPKLRAKFQTRLEEVTKQAGIVLRQVGHNLKSMQKNRPPNVLLGKVKCAAEELQRFMDHNSGVFVTFTWSPISAQCSPNRFLSDFDVFLHTSKMNKVPHSGPMTLGMAPKTFLSVESTQSAGNFSLATVISLLIETVARLEHVVEVVDQLGIVAKFGEAKLGEVNHVAIDMPSVQCSVP